MSENFFSSFIGRDMAVDLGTANTLVYVRGRGIVLNEPSVVAVNTRDNRPLAVGAEAKRMIGRTPSHIQAIRTLKDGVIANFEICEKMLRYFIHKVHQRRFAKPRMVICVPSGITGVSPSSAHCRASSRPNCPAKYLTSGLASTRSIPSSSSWQTQMFQIPKPKASGSRP